MICKQIDAFFEGHNFIVQVELTNGEVVYLDNWRPGEIPGSAWLRLKSYCEEHMLRVKNINAICQQGNVPLLQNCEQQRTMVIDRIVWLNGVNLEIFCVGAVEGDQIKVLNYAKKPLGLVEITFRQLEGNEWLVI